MRFFRFSRWMILVLLVNLASVIAAIEAARTMSVKLTDPSADVVGAWWTIPGVFFFFVAFMAIIGAIGYGLLHMMGRAGTDRLSNALPRQK